VLVTGASTGMGRRFRGQRCLSLADYVRGPAATGGATAAGEG